MASTRKREYSPHPQHLYVLREQGTANRKLGVTWHEVKSRAGTLQCGNPRKLHIEIMGVIKSGADANLMEQHLLKRLTSRRRGSWASEWFKTQRNTEELTQYIQAWADTFNIKIKFQELPRT